jgi:hypothetical protein
LSCVAKRGDYFDAAGAGDVAALGAVPAGADALASAGAGAAVVGVGAGAGAGVAAGAGAGGATTVSSFLLQATRANEATRVAIRSELFILVL